MDSLKYDTLDLPTRQFRLLTLLPGCWEDDIHCQLTIASLDESPEYETISYAWGDENFKRPIFVNGTSFPVTVNLQNALRRFRREQMVRIMWADAICINQEDIDERSQQVAIMGAIYKQCREVQIWIGEEDDFPLAPLSPTDSDDFQFLFKRSKSDLKAIIRSHNIKYVAPIKLSRDPDGHDSCLDVPAALQLLRLLAKDKHFYELPFFEITSFPAFVCSKNWLPARRSLMNILSRPWWKRIWTAQEAILPPKATVHLGLYFVDLKLFLQASDCFWKHCLRRDCCGLISAPWFKVGEESLGLGVMMNLLTPLIRMRSSSQGLDIDDSLFLAFHLSTYRECTYPHDSIYGVLGLVPDLLPQGTLPNYTIDVATIYCQSTKRLLDGLGDLSPLGWSNNWEENPYELPSWALNWHKKMEEQFLNLDECDASGVHRSYKLPASTPSDKVLSIQGVFIGLVEQITSSCGATSNVRDLSQVLRRAHELALTKAEINEDEFLRTICMNKSDQRLAPRRERNQKKNASMTEEDLRVVRRWWKRISSPEPLASPYHTASGTPINFKMNRTRSRFFTCDVGTIGVAPSRIRENDRLYVVKGAEAPFVLRPCAMASELSPDINSDGQYFKFVGVCYLHKFMNGEIFDVAGEEDVEWETDDEDEEWETDDEGVEWDTLLLC